ncbi:Head-to-tail connector protein, podovirus-type [uncultured Caudovirales phage]|uniref:Head-to-tail connector protein, podovirus-type n=1 Tax=uncultured Caudovirales phage TaxID=2100421 RepID=A0A6J5LX41_9CAUD|nr:Head-to-tail connector protein, podovirus-type [uncultured Caudovirales phage]
MEEKNDYERQETAQALYEKLTTDRHNFLTRARDCSKYTIPTLIPPDGNSSGTKYYTPYQGIGARGVNNLASKLLLALLPPNSPFFRLQIDDFTLEQMTQQEGMRASVEEGLNKIERSVQSEIESGAIRVSGFEAMKHLLVGGNALLYLPDEGGMRVFPLEKFVVRRDPMGNVLDIIVKESIAKAALPKDIREMLPEEGASKVTPQGSTKDVDLYTHVCLHDGKWKVYQEIKGQIVPKSEGTYPKDKSPWIPVRFTKVDGENYGRSYVEEYLGDVKSLEGLSQSIVEGSAAAAKVLFMVNPNGTTSQQSIAEAANGAIIEGNDQDVTVLQLNKFNDFRVALETSNKIEERLAFAFLLNSSVQRNGERVTAEEIRYMANELESALGGIYSILSQEMQLPMINRIMFSMERKKKMPVLPKGTVKPVIVTGIEALGRGNDMNKLQAFFQAASLMANLPPEINREDALKRLGTSLGIDMKGLVKSAEQLQAEQEQAQQMAMMQQAMPNLINQGGNLMKQGMANTAQAEQGAPGG